jgi:DNA-binding transcriptional ArsR family regulator
MVADRAGWSFALLHRIVHLLLHEEMCSCDLAMVVGVSESAVSQHLRVLRSLRLVRARRDGKVVAADRLSLVSALA